MTIFFSGNDYKYEIEGIAKLFFPVVHFKLIYDELHIIEDNSICVRLKKGKQNTLLWVRVNFDGMIAKAAKTITNIQSDQRNECERILCILLYKTLQKLTKIAPPWGILTGIRPVSLIQKMRAEGKDDKYIYGFLQENYLVSKEKLQLSFMTADQQRVLLKDVSKKSYSLYVSIPFCAGRCSYCSFVSQSINTKKSMEKVDEYITLLCKELSFTADIANEIGLKLQTIYIGGGTPTALSATQLKRVTDAIAMYFDVDSAIEYTIEAGRADTITEEKLMVIKNSGAKRISVNPQTFNDDVLAFIGRRHTAKQAIDCYFMAKSMGFDSINMDFIAGLPTDSLDSFKASIDKAIELSPSNITVHTLSIKRSSDLYDGGGEMPIIAKNITLDMTKYAQTMLINAGYKPYYLYRQKNTVGNLENVGYAKEGYESLYNVYIMDEIQTILACGAGGATKLVDKNHNDNEAGKRPIERIFNYKYHYEYINQFEEILNRKAEVKHFYE